MFAVRATIHLPAVLAAWSAIVLTAGVAQAQLPRTKLYSIFPPGGKVGASVELRVTGGDDMEELSALEFSHAGIKAVPKMQKSNGKDVPVANTFVVSIDGKVPPGQYEVRSVGLYGMSNPRNFVVGTRDETVENEANNSLSQATPVKIGQAVNAAIAAAADVDWYKFTGKKGQRIIVHSLAARIDSRLHAVLELYGPAEDGRRLAFARLQMRKDPFLDVVLPADGEYFLKVHDFVYRGGNDYFYRLEVHTGPHIDFVLPPAGVPDSNSRYTVYGRNLPGGKSAGVSLHGKPLEKITVNIRLPGDPSLLETSANLAPYQSNVDGIEYAINSPQGRSNAALIQFSSAAVSLEKEPNDQPAQATKISVPGEIAGQFQTNGDVDYVTFEAKKDDVYYVEVFGQRHGSTADPYLTVEQVTRTRDGKENIRRITAQDDNTTNLAPRIFDTISDDPVYRFQVSADGTYRIAVRDRYFESRGDVGLVWRLAIRKALPDYRLVVLPETPPRANNQPTTMGSLALRRGENLAVRVLVFRRDGFAGTIDISADGLPPGVVCNGAAIGGGQTSAHLIFTADEKAAKWSGLIQIVGKSRIDDPARVKALATARAAVKPARDAVNKLTQDLQKAQAAHRKLTDDLQKSQTAAAKNAKDKNLARQTADLQKQVLSAKASMDKLATALKTAEAQAANAVAAAKKAETEKNAAVRNVVRSGRGATIVWNAVNNQSPSLARLGKSIGLSVLEEAAPFQLTSTVHRVQANQGRQVLFPVTAFKRSGFIDNNVNLQFTGLPRSSNIQVQNKPLAKGKKEELYRLFVRNNARPGAYTVYLRSQVQINYRRNAQKADRLKKALDAINKRLKTVQDELKKLTARRDARTRELAAAQQKLKQAQQAKSNADKHVQAATAKVKSAGAAGKDAAKKKQLQQAQQELQQAQQAATAAGQAVAAGEKAASSLQAEQKKLADVVKQKTTGVTALQAQQKTADQQSKAAANTAKPKRINVFPISTPIVIEVRPAPAALSASVPGGGNLKKGKKIAVKVTVRRQNGFAGPLTLTLPLPPGVKGVSAAPVAIPANKNDGVITIQAAADATTGTLQNMVVRATMEFDGKAAVDAPITLKVSK